MAREHGYIYRIGHARIFFLSGQPAANIVGATATLLLEVDEAQDIVIDNYDKDIAPMAASTNATRVFWGTAWTTRHPPRPRAPPRPRRPAPMASSAFFTLTADEVAREVPAYGHFVAEQIATLGRNHPLVRTQFFSEEIDAQAGMFTPARRALMQGSHPPQSAPPSHDRLYTFLLDVEANFLPRPLRHHHRRRR